MATPAGGSLAVQVGLAAQVDDAVEQELHHRLAGPHVLSQAQRLLHVPADLGEAGVELLVAVVLALAAGLVAPIVLVAALGQGGDPHIELDTEQWRATPIRRGGFVPIAWKRLRPYNIQGEKTVRSWALPSSDPPAPNNGPTQSLYRGRNSFPAASPRKKAPILEKVNSA